MGNTNFKAELRFDICLISVGSVACPNMIVFSDTSENRKKHQPYINLTFLRGELISGKY